MPHELLTGTARYGHQAAAPPARTLLDILAETAARHPEAPALDDSVRQLDYRALHAEITDLAERFGQAGVGRGDRVGVRIPSGSADLYIAILGALAAGAAYVPVDVDDPEERARLVFGEAAVRAVIGEGLRIDLRASGGAPAAAPEPGDDAWIIFTSGSTGTPKGVAVTHRSAAAFVDAEARIFLQNAPLGPGDRVLAGLSVAFDASCEEMWLAWRHGACLVPAPRALVRSGVDLGPWLVERRITAVSTVPTLAALWPAEALDHVRLLIFGGEACPPELAERLAVDGREVWNTYGPTEATVVATAALLTGEGPVRIGLPLDGWELTVIDPQGEPVAPGGSGELVIAGVGMARYLDPEKDAAKYAPLPSVGWDRAYRSGDLVRADPEGLIFLGRADEQIKLGGRRIELGEIDAALQALPGVAAAAAAVKGPVGAQVLIGYVVPSEPVPDHVPDLRPRGEGGEGADAEFADGDLSLADANLRDAEIAAADTDAEIAAADRGAADPAELTADAEQSPDTERTGVAGPSAEAEPVETEPTAEAGLTAEAASSAEVERTGVAELSAGAEPAETEPTAEAESSAEAGPASVPESAAADELSADAESSAETASSAESDSSADAESAAEAELADVPEPSAEADSTAESELPAIAESADVPELSAESDSTAEVEPSAAAESADIPELRADAESSVETEASAASKLPAQAEPTTEAQPTTAPKLTTQALSATQPRPTITTVALDRTTPDRTTLDGTTLDRGPIPFDAVEARSLLAAKLPAALVPRIVVVDSLPTRTSGKVDRNALPWPLPDSGAADPSAASEAVELTPQQEVLAEHWAAVLGERPASADADFFDAGGGSLAAARFVSVLRAHHPTVTVRDVYDNPSFGALSERLTELTPAASATAARPQVITVVKPIPRSFQLAQAAVGVPLGVIGSLRWLTLLAASTDILAPSWAPHVAWGWIIAGFLIFGTPPGRIVVTALGVRTLLRGLEPGEYPRGGGVHFRLWTAEQLALRTAVVSITSGPWISFYARALGARIHPDAVLHSPPPITGMLRMAEGAAIEPEVDLAGHWIDAGTVRVGEIRVGANASVGTRSTLLPGARIGEHARLAPGSAFGGVVPGGEHWDGSPARRVGKLSKAERLVERAPYTRHWTFIYSATSAVLGLLPLAAALPAIALLSAFTTGSGSAWAALGEALPGVIPAAFVFLASFALLVLVGVRALGIRMVPGDYPLHSLAAWRVWTTTQLMGMARVWLYPLYASVATPAWLRALGMKIGRDVELSTVLAVPAMTTVGRRRVPRRRHDDRLLRTPTGWLRVEPVPHRQARLPRQLRHGRAGPVGAQERPGRRALGRAPRKAKKGSSWLGSPPVRLRARPEQARRSRTFDPPARLRGAASRGRAVPGGAGSRQRRRSRSRCWPARGRDRASSGSGWSRPCSAGS
jgi:amino acid adenylation domain-containing protein